jgi:RNA polymerase sigma factor (sigma-70 family)
MRRGAPIDEIERVYRSRLPAFLRVAAAVAGRDAADDAVHEGFVAAVRGRRRYRGTGTVEAWLWRAVVTSALKQRRRAAGRAAAAERPDFASPNGGGDDLGHVRAAVALLPERQRLVLFLRYYADLDYRAIADALGISPGTVGAALHAAHAALRSRLEEVHAHD